VLLGFILTNSPACGWDIDKDINTKTIGRKSVLK